MTIIGLRHKSHQLTAEELIDGGPYVIILGASSADKKRLHGHLHPGSGDPPVVYVVLSEGREVFRSASLAEAISRYNDL